MTVMEIVIAAGFFMMLVFHANHNFLNYLVHNSDALNAASLTVFWKMAIAPGLITFAFFIAAARIGRRWMPSVMRLPLAIGLLYGIFGECCFLAGIAGAPLINAACITLSVLVIFGLLQIYRSPITPWPLLPRVSWRAAILAGALIYALWHTFVLALASPLEWDVLAYHLALPKLYVQANHIVPVSWMIHSHWPHLSELLYVLPIYSHADQIAALLHWSACVAWLIAIYALCKDVVGRRVAWIAVLLVSMQPVFLRFAGTAHSDGIWSLFHFLSACAIWRWKTKGDSSQLLLAGVFGGLAASCKLIGLPLATLLACWIGWNSNSGERTRNFFRFLIPTGLIVFPWYLWTAFHTGNPFWPFFSRWLGGTGAALIERAYVQVNVRPWGEFAHFAGRYQPLFLVGPFLASWMVLMFRRRAFPPLVTFLLFPAPFFIFLFFWQNEFWRFMLPIYPGFCIAVAYGIETMWREEYIWKACACALLATACSGLLKASENNALFEIAGIQHFFAPAPTVQSAYLEKSLDIYRVSMMANVHLSATDKVLLFGDLRGYYLDVPYEWGDPVNQAQIVYGPLKTGNELKKTLRARGVTCILVNEAPVFYHTYPQYYEHAWALIRELTATGQLIARDGPIALYRVLQ
jgi:hypothetical protein